MIPFVRFSPVVILLYVSVVLAFPDYSAHADEKPSEEEIAFWNIESPPGPGQQQTIDCDTGTWINLDVSPDGTQVVFDLLGDIYIMPIGGADGTKATRKRFPKNLTNTVAWEMQPRFSPDGKSIAVTSDRTGKSKKAGDNIWILSVDGSQTTQVTNESYRLLSSPTWSPDGKYLVARKHFTSRRSLALASVGCFIATHWRWTQQPACP